MPTDALRGLVTGWKAKIELAWNFKKGEFQNDADEAMRFFNGPYDFLYGWRHGGASASGFSLASDEEVPAPTFRMTVNKVAELVQLFGPSLYHKNPVRKVNPRKAPVLPIEVLGDPQDPNIQMVFQQLAQQVQMQRNQDASRAAMLESYLNYTPTALDLKTESRWAIDEALIKGMGLLWTGTYHPAGAGLTMVGSFYDTVDNLLIDPDAERMSEVQWIAQRCVHPFWKVERDYQLPEGSLKGRATLESFGRLSEVAAAGVDGDYMRRQGRTNDLLVYWKIWSKMGVGGRLAGMNEELKAPLEAFGDYCFLVICDSSPYPLNLPPPLSDALLEQEPIIQQAALQEAIPRVRWETPYWADDTWPFTPITFHPVPRKIWPMSHIKPGMGELKFLNWAFSFLAGKVRTASRDFVAVAKSAGEELKERIRIGPDYTMIEVDSIHDNIDKVVKFLQHPEFNGEIYKVIEGVTANFERRTGLTELMYGLSNKQIRSAQEASSKQDMVSVRPDDMANKVEDAMSDIARKEAFAARWHLQPQDVVPVVGQVGAQFWGQLVSAADPAELLHQLEYRIEAGSTKKPNRQLDSSNMQAAMQTLFTPLFQIAMQTGVVGPVNNLISAWAKSMDLDPTGLLIPQPLPAGPGATHPAAPPPARPAA